MGLREFSVSCQYCISYSCCCEKTSLPEAVDVRKFMRAHGGEAEVQQEEPEPESSQFRIQAWSRVRKLEVSWGFQLLKPRKTAPPAGDQVFRYLSLCVGSILIQTKLRGHCQLLRTSLGMNLLLVGRFLQLQRLSQQITNCCVSSQYTEQTSKYTIRFFTH